MKNNIFLLIALVGFPAGISFGMMPSFFVASPREVTRGRSLSQPRGRDIPITEQRRGGSLSPHHEVRSFFLREEEGVPMPQAIIVSQGNIFPAEEVSHGMVRGTLENASRYLNGLRQKLRDQGRMTFSLEENDIVEEEKAVNREALAEGVSPQVLHLLRAYEYYDFATSAFRGARNQSSSFSREDTSDQALQAFAAERNLLAVVEEAEHVLELANSQLRPTAQSVVMAVPLNEANSHNGISFY